MNSASIYGMRGCYLSTDKEDKFLFVGGWHDGKVTVMRLNEEYRYAGDALCPACERRLSEGRGFLPG